MDGPVHAPDRERRCALQCSTSAPPDSPTARGWPGSPVEVGIAMADGSKAASPATSDFFFLAATVGAWVWFWQQADDGGLRPTA